MVKAPNMAAGSPWPVKWSCNPKNKEGGKLGKIYKLLSFKLQRKKAWIRILFSDLEKPPKILQVW